jgi:murein DD-endopeptidase MepM/ murein hydrolase activator NlpD
MPSRRLPTPQSSQRPRLPLIGLASLAIMGGGGVTALADPASLAGLKAGLRSLHDFNPAPTHPAPVMVRAGESLAAALLRAGASPAEAQGTASLLSGITHAAGARPLTLEATLADRTDGRLTRLVVRGPGGALVLRRGFDGALHSAAQADDVREVITVARGRIQGSLYESAERAGADPALIEQASALVSRGLDAARDVKPGDPFTLVLRRQVSASGAVVETGDLLFAEIGAGSTARRFYAFGRGDDAFFDDSGARAGGFLLRTPVDGARVTSAYGLREHPILGYTRLHQGVDFGAAPGTPVLAAGDGVVEEAKVWGGYGNWLRIRHAGGWETGYAHLMAYASGVAPGSSVRQGQVIGYVGRSGLATGPHLHYEVWLHGVRIDPAGEAIPRGEPLFGERLLAFRAQKDAIDALRTAAVERPPAQAAENAGLKPAV